MFASGNHQVYILRKAQIATPVQAMTYLHFVFPFLFISMSPRADLNYYDLSYHEGAMLHCWHKESLQLR